METTTPERVDEEINKCTELLSDLRAQKNSFLPIFRLPPETLANVFIHAARHYYEGNGRPAFRVPCWVNVSYVCRHWRNVALNCPMLWAYHFTVSPRWTEELLARSKQASLKIRVKYDYKRVNPWWSRLMEKVLNHAGRIQELRLDLPGDILPTELPLNAPRLQILDIGFWHCPSGRTLMINNANSLTLRTLKLASCPLPWHSTFNLSGVTTLSLWFVPSPFQQNIMEFLTTLSRMHALTVLHLEDALPSARSFLSSGAFGVSTKVSLPCLARFFVRAPLSMVVALLSCIDVPLKTHVRLESESECNSSIDDYALLPSVVSHRFSQSEDPSSSSPAIRSLVIHFSYDSRFTLSASDRGECDPNQPMLYPPENCNIPFSILIAMEQSMTISNRDRITSDICCSIPSTHVQTLRAINPPFSPDFWRKTLGHLDGLSYMKLSNGYMPDLVSFLTFPASGPVDATSSGHDHTFVPALEVLELYCIKFSSKDGLSDDAVSEQSLLHALSTRKALRLLRSKCSFGVGEDEDEEDEPDVCQCDLCLSEESE